MSFYLVAPLGGEMDAFAISKTINERLQCYQHIYSGESDNEPLVALSWDNLHPGTWQDCLSHFLLRTKTFHDAKLRRVFTRNEVKLMETRFDLFNKFDLKRFVKRMRTEAQELLEGTGIETLGDSKRKTCLECVRVSLLLQRLGALEHAFKEHPNDEPCEDCEKFCLQVDYESCLDLVACSKYRIHHGKVQMFGFQWKQVILALFQTYLINALNAIQASENIRCGEFLQLISIKLVFDTLVDRSLLAAISGPGSASADSGTFPPSAITSESVNFPPCMRRFYDVLQKDHRLGHYGRFHFSLFLKSIGVSMEEQLKYWEELYLKEPGEDAKCTHSWEKHNKRYVYSVRHMYGLEGSGQESFVKPCIDIENIKLSVNEEGGCPFAQQDDHGLKKLLKKYLPICERKSEDVEVMIHERKTLPQRGCQAYFKTSMLRRYKCRVADDQIMFNNPAEFYLLADEFVTKNDRIPEDPFESSSSSEEESSYDHFAIRSSSGSSEIELNDDSSRCSSTLNNEAPDELCLEDSHE